jgi:heme-degrading monooxygenase HmoA
MIVCIIEYGVRPGMEGRLEEAFASLVPEIQTIGGFISMDNFQSQTRPGVMLEVSYWRDERALNSWIDNAPTLIWSCRTDPGKVLLGSVFMRANGFCGRP